MKKMQIRGLLLLLMLFSTVTVFSAESPANLYQSDGLTITENKAAYKGKVIYDAVAEYEQSFKELGDRATGLIYTYRPLSLIGPYYSFYFEQLYEPISGPVRTVAGVVQTINVITNKPVGLLEIVDEASLVNALKKDSWVRKKAKSLIKLNLCRTFNEILQLDGLNDEENRFDPKSFAFFKLDQKSGMMVVRLILPKQHGVKLNQLLQLGLWVKPKKGMEKLFLQKSNFFMEDFK